MKVGQGPAAVAVGAGGECLDTFSLIYPISILCPSLWETARYRLKYSLKGSLDPKQPTISALGKGGGVPRFFLLVLRCMMNLITFYDNFFMLVLRCVINSMTKPSVDKAPAPSSVGPL